MARQQGYFYDENGKFTHSEMLEEREVWVTETYYEDRLQEVITEEKLCELHQSIKDGTYIPVEGEPKPVQPYECPNCVMRRVDYEYVKVPFTMDVYKGTETVIPPNCTLEQVPDWIYDPVFRDGTWVKLNPNPTPPEVIPPAKTDMEIVKEQLVIMMEGLDSIFAGEGSVSKYLAMRIKDGKLDYTRVIDKRPDLKAEIDFILNSKTEI